MERLVLSGWEVSNHHNYIIGAEKANFEALIKWQEKNNVDFYVGLDGTVFRD